MWSTRPLVENRDCDEWQIAVNVAYSVPIFFSLYEMTLAAQ